MEDLLSTVTSGGQALYLVRCEGHRADGRPCGVFLSVSATEKGVCPLCGWVAPCYPAYASQRSVVKSVPSCLFGRCGPA